MDIASWLLIPGIIAIGALSAWTADVWGHKIGKKRLSIWKLRPKHIARLGVIGLGIALPLATIGLIWWASADFRVWLVKGRAAIAELQQKSAELDRVNRAVQQKADENKRLEDRNRVLTATSAANLKKTQEQQKKLAQLNTKLGAQLARVTTMQASLAKLNLLNAKSKAQFEKTAQLFKKAQASLSAVQTKLTASQLEYSSATQRYNEISSRNLKLTSENGELVAQNRDITEKLSALQAQLTTLTSDLDRLQKERQSADEQTSAAQKALTEAQNNLSKTSELIRQQVIIYNQNIQALNIFPRLNPVTFLRGEELGRAPVPPEMSVAEATNAYRAVLRRARTAATNRGAVADDTYPFTGSAGMLITDSNNRPLSEEQVEELYVEKMANQKDAKLLLFRTAMNCFTSEPVRLEIGVVPNPIVFRKGELIAETRIDARQSDLEILNKVREFLRTYVNTKARSRNMIPVISRDGESYGEFTTAQYLAAVDKIRKATREVRVVAISTADFRAGDSLQLEIEIR